MKIFKKHKPKKEKINPKKKLSLLSKRIVKKEQRQKNRLATIPELRKQREEIFERVQKAKHSIKAFPQEHVKTGINGLDELLEKGIPKGTSVLICGGPGSGKTIMGLQILNQGACNGENCIYMTFEETEERLRQHMRDFGWNPSALEKKGKLVIKRYDPFAITRSVEALLEKAKGELLIDVSPVLFPENFKPERVVIDSLTAIASAFYGREETYRIYIEQLFRLLEQIGATSFLITESSQIPVKLTESGIEEFLADGVIILYNLKSGNVRESAIEVLKLRGADFQKKIVAMKIENGKGIVVFPEQEVFGTNA